MQNHFMQTSKWTIIVGFCVNNPQSEKWISHKQCFQVKVIQLCGN
jgi:hypothetical protein